MGRPSVAYDVPGVREAVANHVTGLLAPRGDTAVMARHVLDLLSDKVKSSALGVAGRAGALPEAGPLAGGRLEGG